MKKNSKKIDMVGAMKKKNSIKDTAKAQQIGRLSRKAAEGIANEYPDLNVDVEWFQGFIADGMWQNKDADTYEVRAKRLDKDNVMVLIEPVYGRQLITKGKKIIGI